MHVVIIMPTEDSSDLKVFARPEDALACYGQFSEYVGKGGLYSMSLYRVSDAVNAQDAAAAIQNKEVDRVKLLKLNKRPERSQWVTLPDNFDELVRKQWSEFSA